MHGEVMNEILRQNTAPRIFFDQPVTIGVPGREEAAKGRALNLCSGGIFICADELLPEDTSVQLHFCLPDGDPVTVDASVIRAVNPQNPHEPVGMALRFENLEPDHAERIDRFISSRLQPGSGEPVRLRLGELGIPILARIQSHWENFVTVDAELPFLRLGSAVHLQLPEGMEPGGAGAIRWVSVHIPPETHIPRLNIGIELGRSPEASTIDEEMDPVCNHEFTEHSRSLDEQVRAERRAELAS
jgi:uncharacterized protein (TIGR02266 family)